MKKFAALLLIILFVFMCCACDKDQPVETPQPHQTQTDETTAQVDDTAKPQITTGTEQTETEAPITELTASDATVTIDGNTITMSDDGTGQIVDEADFKKTPVVTNRNIGYETMLGPILFKINSIQIAVISTDVPSYASFMNIETGKEYTLISLDVTVENTSDDDISFYPAQGILITDHKEQINCYTFASEDVGGTFYGNVEKTGLIVFIPEKSPADEISSFNLRINGPYNTKYDRLSDNLAITVNIQK